MTFSFILKQGIVKTGRANAVKVKSCFTFPTRGPRQVRAALKRAIISIFLIPFSPVLIFATQSLRYKASTTQKYLKVEYRTGTLMTGGYLEPRSEP